VPVNLSLPPAQTVAGVKLGTCAAGIKAANKDDMVLFALPEASVTAGVFTQNSFCAAPVTVAKNHLDTNGGSVRALLVNSGNANAGTGAAGVAVAAEHCNHLSNHLAIAPNQVLPFSTGVIGEPLPNERMSARLPELAQTLDGSIDAWSRAARGIMTTDTVPKLTSTTVSIGDQTVTITGMSKGAGMIEPNMATMLAYVFTDAAIAEGDLSQALSVAVAQSFNAITVDSDTSTNDACMLSATGIGPQLMPAHADWPAFQTALNEVLLLLAQAIVRDAEGATKFITVSVSGAAKQQDCRDVAYGIANSPLVKTAMFASDANVGRLLMAIGKVGIANLNPEAVTVSINHLPVFINGLLHPEYSEEKGSAVMHAQDITVSVDLGMGVESTSVYTSDLSHDYVTINAEYRT